MKVIKRDGTEQEFNLNKIKQAITKAFHAVKKTHEINIDQVADYVFDQIHNRDRVYVEEIQDLVETALMIYKYYDVAKAYIIYRKHQQEIREFADKKINFINKYKNSDNTANATVDDNSNVSNHNIAVLNAEIHKEENIDINLRILANKLHELYPEFDIKQMYHDFNSIAYLHDSSSQIGMPYCVAISLYPFLLNGLKDIGGLSAKPKSLESFCGMFINLCFAIAAQYKGALATPGLFICMDWFCRQEWGDDYYLRKDEIVSSISKKKRTIEQQLLQYFQQITYSINQPSAARGAQSIFWNISIFDKEFYNTMYGDFKYPDATSPQWESFNYLQKLYTHWLNQERLQCVLTFPVVSVALIYKDHKFIDEELVKFTVQEYAEGNSFFTYINDSPESLSSCCRLSSKISKPQFNFTNGQIGEMTGSKNVITLNFNRIVQDFCKENKYKQGFIQVTDDFYNKFKLYIEVILDRIYKYQIAYNECLYDLYNADLLPVYKAGFIDLKKQYLTIGINALNQCAEFLGIKCDKNEDYKKLCNFIFTTLKENNTKRKTDKLMFNTEFTPCESAAIKMYNRDKKDGYWVPSDTNLYASYIFKPNDTKISVLDKLYLHGNDFCGDNLDGGSASHINLENHLSISQNYKILKYAAEVGCKYFTYNIPNSECDDCGYITKHPIKTCPKCGSTHITWYSRPIGYLTAIKNWSKGRQDEFKTRVHHKSDEVC